MNLIDIGVLAILLISALFAFKRGFSAETISIFALVATVAGTYFLYPTVRPFAHQAISIGLLADGIALFVTFVGLFWVSGYIAKRIGGALKVNNPGQFDRSLGFVYGLARGLVLVALGFWFLGLAGTEEEPPAYVAQASIYPFVAVTADALSTIVPQVGAHGARGVASNSDQAYVAPAGSQDEDGYDDSERQALDQLIESTSGD